MAKAGEFPLGKTGGLIEARSAPAANALDSELPGFRWVKPAASLKLLGPAETPAFLRLVSAG